MWDSVMHAKAGVIDTEWSWVGSSNLDRRSVAWNDEVDAVVLGPEMGAALEAATARIMARATPVSLDRWRERGAGQRLSEWLTRPVLDLL